MSCVPIPDPHRQILDLLRGGPQHVTDLEQTTGTKLTEPVNELRAWGWVFGDLELSGVGWYHAGHRPVRATPHQSSLPAGYGGGIL
jgi:hypothetical protein